MIRSLRTGITGLKSNQVKMDVIGNNIANVNTVAFKRNRTAFQEMLGQQMVGVGRTAGGSGFNPSHIGLGVSVGAIDQNWGQGALEHTGLATDLALDGEGFFVAKNGDQQLLTRAGNFSFNNNGELVTATGRNIQGWAFDGPNVRTGELSNIAVDFNATAAPKTTENIYVSGNLSADVARGFADGIDLAGTLDAAAADGTQETLASIDVYDANGDAYAAEITLTKTANADEWSVSLDGGVTTVGTFVAGTDSELVLTDPFGTGDDFTLDLSDVESGDASSVAVAQTAAKDVPHPEVSSVVYDPTGTARTLTTEFTKLNDNTWQYRIIDAERDAELTTGIIAFNPDGTINTDDSDINSNYELDLSWDMDGDGTDESLTLNFQSESNTNQLTQYSGSTTAAGDSDGYQSGTLLGYNIDPDGILQLNFSNGQQEKLFQLAIAHVNNPNGLKQMGDNFYGATSSSGNVQLAQAGRDLRTSVVTGTLEMSNVDLANEFTDMIVTQRGFQAAARVITTSDELLQETVQLKR